MSNPFHHGKSFSFLKIINLTLLIFWAIYFIDAFLPPRNSLESITDFEEFYLRGRNGPSGNVLYKKLITGERHFTVYADENDFFIADTLDLKLTPIFGLVKRYRKFSSDSSIPWIVNRYSPYRRWTTLFITIGLMMLGVYASFITIGIENIKLASFFTITGAIIFILSTLM